MGHCRMHDLGSQTSPNNEIQAGHFSSDCTNPFMIHFHTDADADTVIAATIAQISRGWSHSS